MPRRRLSRPTPPIAHVPGCRLEQDVRAALAELRQDAIDGGEAIHMVNEKLHGALAYTAALGETCQVAGAADAVHEAERHLDACEVELARTALEMALTLLRSPDA